MGKLIKSIICGFKCDLCKQTQEAFERASKECNEPIYRIVPNKCRSLLHYFGYETSVGVY